MVEPKMRCLFELFTILKVEDSKERDVELVIHMANNNLVMRDMTAYLDVADRVYGRLTPEGLKSYAQSKIELLQISEVKQGSLEFIIEKIFEQEQAQRIIILWLCLKYIPIIAQKATKSYDNYQQGLLARETRKRIQHEMEKDKVINQLKGKSIESLSALVNELLEKESNLLFRASRFASENRIEVFIQKRKSV
jgi:hypothetical protein